MKLTQNITDLYTLATSLDGFKDNDDASLDLFSMNLEREWEARLDRVTEFHGFHKEEYEREMKVEFDLLSRLCECYEIQEKYERCSRIQALLKKLKKSLKNKSF